MRPRAVSFLGLAAAAGLSLALVFSPPAGAEQIGEVDTAFKLIGPTTRS